MDAVEAARVLAVELPTTPNALKRAYHRRAREEHPDASRAKDAAARFDRVRVAYEFLLARPESLLFAADVEAAKFATDGTPLSKLGKGLGPKVNGARCDDCRGYGFRSVNEEYIDCPDCRTIGFFLQEYCCKRCRDGVFHRNGKPVGTCFTCNGKGWIRGNCVTCRGERVVQNPRGRVSYYTCKRCKGCGELPMWNPVLPKGLLGGI